jgi:hypothetical protein
MTTTAAVPAFAVVLEVAQYCPSTDAPAGSSRVVKARFTTRSEAETYANEFNERDDYYGDCHAFVDMRPYREGEDELPPARNLLEERNDNWARECRDAGAPWWAL